MSGSAIYKEVVPDTKGWEDASRGRDDHERRARRRRRGCLDEGRVGRTSRQYSLEGAVERQPQSTSPACLIGAINALELVMRRALHEHVVRHPEGGLPADWTSRPWSARASSSSEKPVLCAFERALADQASSARPGRAPVFERHPRENLLSFTSGPRSRSVVQTPSSSDAKSFSPKHYKIEACRSSSASRLPDHDPLTSLDHSRVGDARRRWRDPPHRDHGGLRSGDACTRPPSTRTSRARMRVKSHLPPRDPSDRLANHAFRRRPGRRAPTRTRSTPSSEMELL